MKNILKLILISLFGLLSLQTTFACVEGDPGYPNCSTTPPGTQPKLTPEEQETMSKNPIKCDPEKGLAGGGCTINVNGLVGVKGPSQGVASRGNVLTFTQDLVTGLTFFIGTLVLISLIYSGWLYLMAGGDEKMSDKGKNGIKNSIIGLVLVLLSYAIMRAIQFFATGR